MQVQEKELSLMQERQFIVKLLRVVLRQELLNLWEDISKTFRSFNLKKNRLWYSKVHTMPFWTKNYQIWNKSVHSKAMSTSQAILKYLGPK